MTDEQIEHDRFLRRLATSPGDGLAHWKRLPQGDQVVVITYMTMAYDSIFAGYFLALANRNARPDLLVTVTNDRDLTPERLKSRGFRRKGMSGSAEVWIAPNGNEVWLLPSPKAVPPVSVAPPTAPSVHPDIQEIQTYIQDYQTQRSELYRKSKDLRRQKATLSADEYARLRKEWDDEYEQFEDGSNELLNDTIPGQVGQLTAEEQKKKDEEIRNLRLLTHSLEGDFFPPNP